MNHTKSSLSRSPLGSVLLAGSALFALANVQAAPTNNGVSSAADRKQVSLTVYNQDFGLVREVRELPALPSGRVALEFRDVPATIQPETVHIRSLVAPDALRVLEQNYRFDLLSPETLLQKYVGKDVHVYRYHPATGKEDVVDARLLSTEGRPVLSINNEITFDYGGRFGFKDVPENLIAKPTLIWLLESNRPRQQIEVSYLAQSMNWHADYVLVLDDKETRADLSAWVTLNNQSGASYENAELKLVAGDVNRIQEMQPLSALSGRASNLAVSDSSFKEEGLFEYHLYTLGRPTTVLDKEQKQVSLLEAKDVAVEKKLIFPTERDWFRGAFGEVAQKQKVGVYLDLQNSEKNRLGAPLPKGTIRVYKADKASARQFVGEDQIDHTPRDEKLHIKLGEAFDVVGDRKQMRWTALGPCQSESSWEIELFNHKDTEVTVEDLEAVGGDWTIINSSLPATRKDAQTFSFQVRVPARGKSKLSYTVRVRWC